MGTQHSQKDTRNERSHDTTPVCCGRQQRDAHRQRRCAMTARQVAARRPRRRSHRRRGPLIRRQVVPTTSDPFSDSHLADVVAREVLAGKYVWCKALGWLQWTGQRWRLVTDEHVGERVRCYVLERFHHAVATRAEHESPIVNGWLTMLRLARQQAVLTLARGIVEQIAEAFDAHPDLLNTPSGVVDLRTGAVCPHDPKLLLTKITRGAYRPGWTHHDWELALDAVPDPDVRDWLQVRFGQAITGHPTPDGLVPVLQGGGSNGKTVIALAGVVTAMGDYGAAVSPKLILGSKSDHSTERAGLRGQRLLVAEELTEAHALTVTAIKQITDVPQITARQLYKDNASFQASHSLFINTNVPPIVEDTDHGTWRRLALVVFPLTFRKVGEPLRSSTDQEGDPKLKARLLAGADGLHDAIVTWAVNGARRFATEGFPAEPAAVTAATRQWRQQYDDVARLWADVIEPATAACVLTTELYAAFNASRSQRAQPPWALDTFMRRFRAHNETQAHRIVTHRTRQLAHLSRPPGLVGKVPPPPAIATVCAGVRFRFRPDFGPGKGERDPQDSGRIPGSDQAVQGEK
jgi:putative DNA primase/helicase